MKQKMALSELTDLYWLKQEYFSNEEQKIILNKGDELTKQGTLNDKMFFVASGRASGFYRPEIGEEFRVFSTGANMIVGIYSFFSHDNRSYTTVRAEEDSIVYFIQKNQLPDKNTIEYHQFLAHMLPVIVNEIYLRQMLMISSVSEKENVLKKLFESEKLATLGQLAAGLAHELNNAASVIQSKTTWITDHMKDYMEEKDSKGLFPYFLKSLENGQEQSSKEIRSRKQKIQELLQIRESAAKKLARMNLTDQEIESIGIKENTQIIDRLGNYWDAGLALHDINVAATHTTHVVQSIKELGAMDRKNAQSFNLRTSIQKATSLLSDVLKNLEISIDVDHTMTYFGKEGEFVQIWVNLIKNAAESLNSQHLAEPEIRIAASTRKKMLNVLISDNGPGIDKETREKIFQPNYTTKVHGLSFGLGLGLSIVQKIVASYEGEIFVKCQDGWTSFIVELPKK